MRDAEGKKAKASIRLAPSSAPFAWEKGGSAGLLYTIAPQFAERSE